MQSPYPRTWGPPEREGAEPDSRARPAARLPTQADPERAAMASSAVVGAAEGEVAAKAKRFVPARPDWARSRGGSPPDGDSPVLGPREEVGCPMDRSSSTDPIGPDPFGKMQCAEDKEDRAEHGGGVAQGNRSGLFGQEARGGKEHERNVAEDVDDRNRPRSR